MASGKSPYLERALLDLVFGATAWTPPATLYFALSTALFSESGPTEPVGGSYARASLANNTSNWPAASGSPTSKASGADATFATPTAGWGTIKSVYVLDASTAGNWLYGGDLPTAVVVASGQAPSFAGGTLIFREA